MKAVQREELLELLELLLDEDLSWFELRTPTAYIRIGTVPEELRLAPAEAGDGRRPGVPATAPAAAPAPRAVPGQGGDDRSAAAAPQAATPAQAAAAIGEHVVTAPFVGVFYRRPAPNEPPFVEVGSRVRADDTVCLIEVMKLFNSIHAGVDGVITAIEVNDGELVEYGQVLMRIAPDSQRS